MYIIKPRLAITRGGARTFQLPLVAFFLPNAAQVCFYVVLSTLMVSRINLYICTRLNIHTYIYIYVCVCV